MTDALSDPQGARREGQHREGRGQLSSIDMLPDTCEPDIIWALDQLRERRMHSNAILAEFNSRLADRGVKGISKSAWSRWSVRKAVQFRRLDEGRSIMAGLHQSLGSDGNDQITLVLGEMIKLAVFEQLEGGEMDAKTLGNLARTLRNAVKAQADTVEYRTRLSDLEAKLKQVADTVSSGEKGGTKETLAKITSLLTTGA